MTYRYFSRTVYLRQMQSGLLERCRLMKVIFCAANRGCSDGPTVIMSGIQPSGRLHVGNYFGVISQLLKLQADGCQLYVSVADLHAMTVPRQPDELRRNVFNVTSGLLACGLGTGRGTALFQQSRLGEHSELCWMLGTLVTLPKLLRMSHYREKAALYRDGNVPLALLTYPVLQAADVLLYRARAVPVGEDQSQHLRLAHRLAELFNNKYSVRFFPLPERLLSNWPRLKNLREPDKKMSKSQPAGCIFLDDTADEIRSKVKKAVTDSAGGLWFDPQRRPGVSNLIRLKAACTDSTVDDVVARCAGQDVVQFKENLAEALVETLKPIRLKYQALEKQPDQLKAALDDGLAKASVRAQQTMVAFKRIVGLTFYQLTMRSRLSTLKVVVNFFRCNHSATMRKVKNLMLLSLTCQQIVYQVKVKLSAIIDDTVACSASASARFWAVVSDCLSSVYNQVSQLARWLIVFNLYEFFLVDSLAQILLNIIYLFIQFFPFSPPNFAMVHKVAIVGGGSWGSALSVIVGESVERKKHLFDTSVKLWLFREEVNGEDLAELINRQHENVKYLPGIQLPKNILIICFSFFLSYCGSLRTILLCALAMRIF
ncbi:Tryptophan--tRNA ligase, mitochondrial [Trichinella nativa]|uniref:tryptophan--tRNA ligase n=1 Tax=Trichinella nativa TaxID=6335 RepID=A0A0V1KVZ4_9BILA|nr:Tryptophan--tRNA ligase, mitochondrial [Trichinella nativa]